MKRIKLFSLVIALSLVGAVYAAGGFAQSTAQESGKNQPSASCCASGAECCKEGASCCAKHKTDHKNHANQPAEPGSNKESCCASGASCCKDGASCCVKHKADGEKTGEQACDMSQKDGAGCCKEGASCCTGGSCSTARKQ
jgi:hypothetical protein